MSRSVDRPPTRGPNKIPERAVSCLTEPLETPVFDHSTWTYSHFVTDIKGGRVHKLPPRYGCVVPRFR